MPYQRGRATGAKTNIAFNVAIVFSLRTRPEESGHTLGYMLILDRKPAEQMHRPPFLPFPFLPFFLSFFFFFFFTTRQRNNGKRKRGRGEWRVEESIPRDLDTPWGPVPTLSTTPVRFHTPLDYIHRGRWMNIRLPRRRRYSRLRLFLYLFFLSFFLFF